MIFRLCLLIALLCIAVAIEAGRLPYQYPDAAKLKSNDRIYVFQNSSGERNFTGDQFRREALGGDNALSKQPTSTFRYRRIAEYRNYSGQITSYITANGAMVISSRSPQPLSVSAVMPAPGFTGWSTSKPPYVTFNKSAVEAPFDDVNSIYKLAAGVFTLVGQTPDAVLMLTIDKSWQLTPVTLLPNTTYTLYGFIARRWHRTDGEETSSCGAMSDMGGYCQSTFTTGTR